MFHLLLVIHNHQPLGNLPEVFRKAYDKAYAPFLDAIRRHPGVNWALHVSGCLWEWLESEEPGYLDALRREHAAGRLEFLTGAMWEPIQPLLDETSCLLQFKGMGDYLADRFGVHPIGSWTTERVWEPALAGRLAKAGARYTLLDDSQLRAGLPPPEEHQVWGYYRTEHNGRSVAIFPIDEELRYLIPFHDAGEVIAHLEDRGRNLPDNAAITYGDDGEKFGLWPETYDWVYGKSGETGWLDEFLGRLEESKLIATTHPSEYMRIMPHPRQRVYIPTSSYREMGLWTLYPRRNLAAEQIHKWVESDPELESVGPPHPSGFFRTFLARYPESRYMHERVAELVREITSRDPHVDPSSGADSSPLARALWHALRAQCNCAYWHGIFGGLYLNYLRFEVHRQILAAEKALQELKPPLAKVRYLGTRRLDEQGEELPEPECPILIPTERVHWVVDPVTGQVISAGVVDRGADVVDVLARRFEAYHATMREAAEVTEDEAPASIHDIVEVAPSGWREGYGYDPCRRGCFADRLLDIAPDLDALSRVECTPVLGPESGCWLAKARDSRVELSKSDGPWRRTKEFAFEDHGSIARVSLRLSRDDGRPFDGVVLWEFNLGLLAGNAPDRYHLLPSGRKLPLAERFESKADFEAVCVDEWTGVRITMRVPDAEWVGCYPVKTLSRGEGGIEMTYQGTAILFRVPFHLLKGAVWRSEATMSVAPNQV